MAPLVNGMKTMAMEGSSSEESYEKHSGFQNQNFHQVGKPLLEEAVEQLLCNIAVRSAECGRKQIAIADYGCSYGRNTLECAEVILGALQRKWAGRECPNKMPEIQYFFLDLPSNDFNSLFQSLHSYLHHPSHSNGDASAPSLAHDDLPKIFAAGVPGSFHGRLLPSASLDLAICTYSLHWLSQVPPSVLDKSSPAWNGGQPWIYNASQAVVDAYILQSHIDVINFLQSRALELASGGVLFLLLGSSTSMSKNGSVEDDHASRWEFFKCAWEELVKEGVITMEEFDTFNMPMYSFNEHELKDMLKSVPELKVLHMETIESSFNKVEFSLHRWTETIISVAKPLVEAHLGKEKSKELFKRLNNLVSKNYGLTVAHNVLVAYFQRL